LLLLATAPARAVITRLTPLKEVLSGQQYIFTAKVDKLSPDIPGIVLNVDADLKDKVPFRRMPINMTGDSEAQKEKHTEKLFKRLKAELPVIVFAGKRGKQYTAFVYSNGTWFQILGRAGESADKVNWSLAHGEPYLRRTFKGTTEELRKIIVNGLENKKDPPEPNPKEEPGFGPEVDSKKDKKEDGKTENRSVSASLRLCASPPESVSPPSFAVIPTVFIMGPLALLAALFPAVFGGLALFMKRWMALLSVACTNSTLVFLHMLLGGYARGAWWGSTTTLWVAMTLVTLAGAIWSARRYRTVLHDNQAEDPTPRRGEQKVLLGLSIVGVLVVLYSGLEFSPISWDTSRVFDSPWKELLVFWVAGWAGAGYLLFLRWMPKRSQGIPCELIVLWAMLFAYANLTTLEAARAAGGGQRSTSLANTSSSNSEKGAKLERIAWQCEIPGNGSIVSTPLVDGERIYVGVSHAAGLNTFGIVYCLERDSGKIFWQFDADKELMQIFSSPCVADGKLYFGEGLHTDRECRFFCIDAATGKKVWDFTTKSHTESSPCAGGGKVFFGAGDDGVYCLDAARGEKLWQYQPGLHVDASPIVVGKRVYCGSGVSKTHKATAVFCLDADTGKEVWRTDTDKPVWGSPTAAGACVFYGLGNGRYDQSDDKNPSGAVICVHAETGQRLWQCDVPDAVLTKPIVDEHHVYFGSRDKRAYCADRRDGRVVWKSEMGSPVVASLRLAPCPCCGAVTGKFGVYALAADGKVACLDSQSGQEYWTLDLARESGRKPQLFAAPAAFVLDGERRGIVIGTGLTNAASVSNARVYCLEERWKE
jgi:outer membrane protein assembly factor BamB